MSLYINPQDIPVQVYLDIDYAETWLAIRDKDGNLLSEEEQTEPLREVAKTRIQEGRTSLSEFILKERNIPLEA